MDDESEIAVLGQWCIEGPVCGALCKRTLALPRFPEAARALAANMLAAGAADPGLDSLFKDVGHYVAALIAIHLSMSGGLTLPRLKSFCVDSGFLSPGRARALLLRLLCLRYIEPGLARAGGLARTYAVTPRFIASWQAHARAALEAACVLEPGVRSLLDRLNEPDAFAVFAEVLARSLLAQASAVDQKAAHLRVFLHRNAGSQILWLLLTGEGEAFPPDRIAPFAISSLARRFAVSRIHVRRMLAAAEGADLLRHDAPGGLRFTAAAAVGLRRFYALQLAHLIAAAAQTLSALAAPPPRVAGFPVGGRAPSAQAPSAVS